MNADNVFILALLFFLVTVGLWGLADEGLKGVLNRGSPVYLDGGGR